MCLGTSSTLGLRRRLGFRVSLKPISYLLTFIMTSQSGNAGLHREKAGFMEDSVPFAPLPFPVPGLLLRV